VPGYLECFHPERSPEKAGAAAVRFRPWPPCFQYLTGTPESSFIPKQFGPSRFAFSGMGFLGCSSGQGYAVVLPIHFFVRWLAARIDGCEGTLCTERTHAAVPIGIGGKRPKKRGV